MNASQVKAEEQTAKNDHRDNNSNVTTSQKLSVCRKFQVVNMAPGHGAFTQDRKKKGPFKQHKIVNKKSYKEDLEIKELNQLIEQGAPAPGTNPLALASTNDNGDGSVSYAGARQFDELPISNYTKEGLKQAKFTTMTAIQRAALPHALCGRDVLGAAKTGSGKTLAFLIPLVEALYRAKWTRLDGLGAIVLTPTRELAVQIFEELRKVGRYHELSAALLIGGKNVQQEKERVGAMNILVCTPGRLLQHMDETPGFDASGLQMLVLDEADRILDMGFAATLDAILGNLPRERQTMLFSATQTKSVKDLARLSLVDPEYLSVHSDAEAPTPLKLQQAVMVAPLDQKLDLLWSFIKSHITAKTIVFFSTCKQVRFVYEAFKKLRPGVPLRSLHGGMKQGKRMGVFYSFSEAKSMVLFATDVAARGLDFPTVDWVVQADCPEDVAAYIHRVGRTARYTSSGKSLLMLLPSEEAGMMEALGAAKVPVKLIKANPAKTTPIGPALQALLSKNQELKDFAQRAIIAYVRSVFLQPNKAVFDVTKLPMAEYAQSMGLLAAPKLRFLKKVGKKTEAIEVGGTGGLVEETEGAGGSGKAAEAAEVSKSAEAKAKRKEKAAHIVDEEEEAAAGASGRGREDGEDEDAGVPSTSGRPAKAPEPKASKAKAPAAATNTATGEDEDDFLVVKKRNVFNDADVEALAAAAAAAAGGEEEGGGTAAKAKKKKLKIKLHAASSQRVVFDEEGQQQDPLALLVTEQLGDGEEGQQADGVYVVGSVPEERFSKARQLMKARDAEDKKRLKELRREKKLAKKAKLKAQMAEEAAMGGVQLGRVDDGSSSGDYEDGDSGDDATMSGGESDLLADSSDEDMGSESMSEDEGGHGKGKRSRTQLEKEVAHLGMARKEAASAEPSTKRAKSVDGLSLAEQEALALKMLSARRT